MKYGGLFNLPIDFDTVKDLLDDLTEIELTDDLGKTHTLPGLWHGAVVAQPWKTQLDDINGKDGDQEYDLGLGAVQFEYTRLMLSEQTIQNLAGQLIGAGLSKLGVKGPRTCYDELRDFVKIFQKRDLSGAKMVWKIDSELTDIFNVDKVTFVDQRVADYVKSEAIGVTFRFKSYSNNDVNGAGI